MLDVLVLGPDDWQLWRRLRRAALAEAPTAFGSTLVEWSGGGDTEKRWRSRLERVPLHLAFLDAGEPIGMVSATKPGADGAVELISLWVAPVARGRGVGDEAVRRVVAWAAGEQASRQLGSAVCEDRQRSRSPLVRAPPVCRRRPFARPPDERLMRRYPGSSYGTLRLQQ